MWLNRYHALSTALPSSTSSSSSTAALSVSPPAQIEMDISKGEKDDKRTKYPQSAVVFVAGIPGDLGTDEVIQRLGTEVKKLIEVGGIKVIDDKVGNKAAFVQAKSEEDARTLLGSSLIIEGKRLRTELARAHRTVIVSFLPTASAVLKLRIVRGVDGHLRAYINEPAYHVLEELVPHDPSDPFSGVGHTLTRFTYTEESLKRLTTLLGPVEGFRKIPFEGEGAELEESYFPHVLLSNSSEDEKRVESGIWEIKWENRDDAMRARGVLSNIPGVRWSWAHLKVREGEGRPLAANATGRGKQMQGSRTYQAKQKLTRVGSEKMPSALNLSADFPLPDNRTRIQDPDPRDGTEKEGHNRSMSDDSKDLITPLEVSFTVPEVVDHSEGLERVLEGIPPGFSTAADVDVPGLVAGKDKQEEERGISMSMSLPIPMGENTPDAGSRDRSTQFDMTTLYVTGIPKDAKDEEIRKVFLQEAKVERVQRISTRDTSEWQTIPVFVVFETIAEAARVMTELNEGRSFDIRGHKLRIRYRRNNTARYMSKGRSRFAPPVSRGGYCGSSRPEKEQQETASPIEQRSSTTVGSGDLSASAASSFEPLSIPTASASDIITASITTNHSSAIIGTTTEPDKSAEAKDQSRDLLEVVDGLSGSEILLHTATSTDMANCIVTSGGKAPSKEAQPPAQPRSGQAKTPASNNAALSIETPSSTPAVNAPAPPPYAEMQQQHQQSQQPISPTYPHPYYPHSWGQPYSSSHWAPYPAYPPPIYAMQYWYPPGVVPVPPAPYPSQGPPRLKVDIPQPIVSQPPSVVTPFNMASPPSAKAPVAPTGFYHNADGGVSYIYPSEILENYMSTRQDGRTQDRGGTSQSSTSQTPGVSASSDIAGIPVPQVASNHEPPLPSAIYNSHPPLPVLPADRIPQASYGFNPQGSTQYVEPTLYSSGPLSPHGTTQPASAAIARGHYGPPSAYMSASPMNEYGPGQYFPAPPLPPAPYPYPPAGYASIPTPISAEGAEHTFNPISGRGGYRRRGVAPGYGQGRNGPISASTKLQD